MRKLLPIVITMVVVGSWICTGMSWSQESDANYEQVPLGAPSNVSPFDQARDQGPNIRFQQSETANLEQRIESLAGQIYETNDSHKKEALTRLLESAVSESFDLDMKVREARLARLEERLNKLRAQLDRRRKAKADIVQLEVKVLVNEASGLGFSDLPPRLSRQFKEQSERTPMMRGGIRRRILDELELRK
jgi:hypothetical protein